MVHVPGQRANPQDILETLQELLLDPVGRAERRKLLKRIADPPHDRRIALDAKNYHE